MALDTTISVENASPKATWDLLSKSKIALLIDCRTRHEWETTGTPDLDGIDSKALYIEWRKQPDMGINPDFLAQLEAGVGGANPDKLFFLCRSGARSLEAATYVQNQNTSKLKNCACINVSEGFEGDPDANDERGVVNGWKYHKLPWKLG